MRFAFLTMDNTEGWSIDAGLCIPHLEELGWQVEWIPWRKPGVNWNNYAAVYAAAPWDYPEDPIEFMRVMENIASSSAVLLNPIELIRWNVAKTYLRDLQSRGIEIVPSLWYEHFQALNLANCCAQLGCEKIIIKPVISANAANTFLLRHPVDEAITNTLERVFSNRPFMVQPFIENIRSEGEFSLFYIEGELSHTIQKIPAAGDFRVQEEHGASIVAVVPEEILIKTANALMQVLDSAPVYARADFVRDSDGGFLLMELELIEPSMYLRMDDGAAKWFAHALSRIATRSRAG